MQQYQPNMVQNGQQQMLPEMQQYQPQLPQMQTPQLPQMSPMQMQLPVQPVQQQMPDLVKIEKGPITSENFHPLRLTCDEPEKEVMGGTGPKADPPNSKTAQYYFNIPLKSNYGTFTEQDKRTFLYEGPELTTLYGVKSEMNQFGKFKSSIAFSLDEREPEEVKFMSDFDAINLCGNQLVYHYKDKVNYPLFNNDNPKMAQATGFRPLITRKAGKNPALYCDLVDYVGETFSAKTTFTYGYGEHSKVLDWKDLKGMTFKCIPLFRFKEIYIGGGKASMRYDIKSAIVTSPPLPFKAVSMQAQTAERFAQRKTNWQDDIEAQIAKNNMLNQDKKMGAELYIAPKESAVSTVPLVQGTEQNQQVNIPNNTNLEQFMNNNPQQPVVQFS